MANQKIDNYKFSENALKDKNILITGATDGIGRALALQSAKLGARVILHGRNRKKLEAIHDELCLIHI